MTQKLLPILIFLLAFSSYSFGQRNCNAMEVLDRQIQENPDRLRQLEEIEKFTKKYLENADAKAGELVTIPVVFHVVYNTSAENISTAQVNSQLQVLNDDFRRLNSDADGTWPQAADSEIEFCLATQDPSGNAHSGITRTSTSVTSFSSNDNMKFNSSGGHDAWPASDYLNFWVCDLSGGLLGYAQFPGGPANTDGVVCDYQYVGTVGTATAPFDLGRTATHEVGHWLNLRHIWGDGGCSVDDFISDTPTSDASNGGCAVGHVSCGTTDMVQNYMDYSDDACMNLFTAGQRDRMQALFSQGGTRESLLSSPGCGGGGGPTGCEDTEITLTLNFDNYPEETTWEIRNSGGGLEASGGPYGSQPDGSTLLVDVCLTDGCYDFTIFDSYGDGICCGYGNGSYSLDNGPTNLASGGSFGSSETTNFCLSGGGGGDTQAPTTPGNLTASNTTQTSTDLSWNASSDNVGVTGYNVYVGGSLDGSTSGTDYTVTGLSPSTTYAMSVEAYDAAGNTSAPATVNVTTQSSGGGGSDVLHEGYFETGWDGWQDGGSDCYRYSGTRSWEGNYSIRIRDNSGTRSAMTLSNVDVSSYSSLEIEFYFYPNSMENGEDFWVRYYNGSSWSTVAAYASGTSFTNNSFYVATVTINSSGYNFPTNAGFRFQCDASANADRVYVDAVTITGINGARISQLGPIQTIERLDGLFESSTENEFDFSVFPNPASDMISVTADEEIKSLQVYSITGSLLMNLKDVGTETEIDISKLNSGLYLINIETEEEVMSQKFVKH